MTMIGQVPLILGFALLGLVSGATAQEDVALWPEIKPDQSGYLRVSALHEIYYQTAGNPGAQAVM
jgi:hypothetical protein